MTQFTTITKRINDDTVYNNNKEDKINDDTVYNNNSERYNLFRAEYAYEFLQFFCLFL